MLRYQPKMRTRRKPSIYIKMEGMSNEKYYNKNVLKYKYKMKANTFLLYNLYKSDH